MTETSLQRDLTPDASEQAARAAIDWIKALRHLTVDGQPLRDRFTYRGDSLWWFAELYLHKQGVIDRVWRAALALDALCAREPHERPPVLVVRKGDALLECLAPQVAQRFGLRCEIDASPAGARTPRGRETRLGASGRLALDLKSRFYTWSALASRIRIGRSVRRTADANARGGTLAFVHSAFWRKPTTAGAAESGDEGQEGYIGAVLQALAARAETERPSAAAPDAGLTPDASAQIGGAAAAREARRVPGAIGEFREAAEAEAAGASRAGTAGAKAGLAWPVRLIGVGPRTNFKARRWWHAIVPSRAGVPEIPVEAIERFASFGALAGSRKVWRQRLAMERALLDSAALRAHATILGYDIWPIVAEELRGVARLQFPWSARVMDEAAAAMDRVRPRVIVTYAEAGGWGRALMLEARRRGIRSVGLQHGFIYRHWLNYRHEPDEMQPSPGNATDRGFPRPDLTLVYDGYAAQHLISAGNFPAEAVRVTGSPALDALASAVAAARLDHSGSGGDGSSGSDSSSNSSSDGSSGGGSSSRRSAGSSSGSSSNSGSRSRSSSDGGSGSSGGSSGGGSSSTGKAGTGARGRIRDQLGARTSDQLIVLVTKFTQVRERDALGSLLRAVAMLDDVRLIIKPHPAETAEPYRAAAAAAGAPNVLIAPPALDLAALLSVARLVITVNSTVAIDAIALGLPALIVGLPNNLSPFVEAGVMAGGADAAGLPAAITALLHDETYRDALLARARAFAADHAMQPDGRAAERAVDAVLGLIEARPV
jgi:hypothetical protein